MNTLDITLEGFLFLACGEDISTALQFIILLCLSTQILIDTLSVANILSIQIDLLKQRLGPFSSDLQTQLNAS